MKPKSPKSLELYDIMIKRGYPAEFCDQITKNLNTDWTAGRMIGYLSHYKKLVYMRTWEGPFLSAIFITNGPVICK